MLRHIRVFTMFHKVTLITSLCILVSALSSCKQSLQNKILLFESNPVVFPDQMIQLSGDERIGLNVLNDTIQKFILYIDSNECQTCRISNMSPYLQLYNEANNGTLFQIIIILEPSLNLQDNTFIFRRIAQKQYPFFVFADINNLFSSLNPIIQQDYRLHSFLLNKRNYPVLVGDPTKGEKMYNLFHKVLQKPINNEN